MAAVAILALAAAAPPPLALVVGQERLALASSGPVALEVNPFERKITLRVRPAAAEALARRLRRASRVCPDVSAGDGAVVLRCRTERVRASLELRRGGGAALDLRVLVVPSWRPDEEGPPLVPFDPAALGLGACGTEGAGPAARGECALARGERAEARRLFEQAARESPAPLAELRLGDLALADDAPDAAAAHWRRARHAEPWDRLAAARLCELDPACFDAADRRAVIDPAGAAPAVRRDLQLRRVRLGALAGDLTGAARTLAGEWGPEGACPAAPAWCRHVLALALAQAGPDGAAAVEVYLSTPGHAEGRDALPLARAAAARAEAAGAPAFAAALLAARSGEVPAPELAAHLRRITRLYLAAGDRARAEEIVLFARSRLRPAELAGPEWARLRRALRPEKVPARRPDADPDLASAHAALEAARLATLTNGASR